LEVQIAGEVTKQIDQHRAEDTENLKNQIPAETGGRPREQSAK
jgi:hypothetical protein